jgi:hypothetical protein
MLPYPPAPLRFRTPGFPRYGSKAGLSGGTFPREIPVKPTPRILIVSVGLYAPFVLSRGSAWLRSVPEGLTGGAPPFEQPDVALPRGPRSGHGYVVPVHQHLNLQERQLASPH